VVLKENNAWFEAALCRVEHLNESSCREPDQQVQAKDWYEEPLRVRGQAEIWPLQFVNLD
jgi:hypothetical protein